MHYARLTRSTISYQDVGDRDFSQNSILCDILSLFRSQVHCQIADPRQKFIFKINISHINEQSLDHQVDPIKKALLYHT